MNYQQNDFNQGYAAPGKVVVAFSSPLFLAAAILLSANVLYGLTRFGAPGLFDVLLTIGMWLAYVAAFQKAKNPAAPLATGGLTMICGTAKAMKIVYMVLAIILIVSCVLTLTVTIAASGKVVEVLDTFSFDKFEDELASSFTDPSERFQITSVLDQMEKMLLEFCNNSGVTVGYVLYVLMVAVMAAGIIAGVIMLVLSLTFFAKLRKFTVLVRDSARLGIEPPRVRGLGVWLLVIGILSAATPLFAATLIVLFVWYRKFFPVAVAKGE